MHRKSYRRAAGLPAVVAAMILAGDTSAAFGQIVLPTGATITPTAAPGSLFQPLTLALPDYPNYSPDRAETTAISPDGKTLLTSGYNLNLDINGNLQPQDSSEYVFVYDISSPNPASQKTGGAGAECFRWSGL